MGRVVWFIDLRRFWCVFFIFVFEVFDRYFNDWDVIRFFIVGWIIIRLFFGILSIVLVLMLLLFMYSLNILRFFFERYRCLIFVVDGVLIVVFLWFNLDENIEVVLVGFVIFFLLVLLVMVLLIFFIVFMRTFFITLFVDSLYLIFFSFFDWIIE